MSDQYKSGDASLFSCVARGDSRAPRVFCKKCHHEMTLGVNGISTDGGDLCDSCANVVRGADGFAWTSEPNICMCYELMGDNHHCPVHGKNSGAR